MLNVIVVGRGSAEVRGLMEKIEALLAGVGVTVEVSHASDVPSIHGLKSDLNQPHIIVRGTDGKEAQWVGRMLLGDLNVELVEVDINLISLCRDGQNASVAPEQLSRLARGCEEGCGTGGW